MIVSKQNAEHYKWGNECDGWHLLKTDSLSVIEECMPPDTKEQMHYHEKSQQVFYVLSGKATMIVEGEEKIIHACESIYIKPGMKHQMCNKSNSELRFIVISEPRSHGDRINCE